METSTPLPDPSPQKKGGAVPPEALAAACLPATMLEAVFCTVTGAAPATVAELRKAHLQQPAETYREKKRRLLTPGGVLRLLELLELGPEALAKLRGVQAAVPEVFVIVKKPMNARLLRVRATHHDGGTVELLVRCRDNSQFRIGAEVCAIQEGDIWRVIAKKKGGRN